jgi:hypothetical protein
VHPGLLARKLLSQVNLFVAVGETPVEMLREFCDTNGLAKPPTARIDLRHGEALVWRCGRNESPFVLQIAPSHTERRRHIRKYAEGELPPERSFYFRGREGKLNLRAHNLVLFLQLSDGVDEDTWQYHLSRHDYSRWIAEYIKDADLSAEVRRVENDASLSPQESRRRIHEEIERRYTLPAGPAGSMDGAPP